FDHVAGILAQRGDQADGTCRRRLALLQLRTALAQQCRQPRTQLGIRAVQPERTINLHWRELRFRRADLLSVLVAVEALAALASEQPGRDTLGRLIGWRVT